MFIFIYTFSVKIQQQKRTQTVTIFCSQPEKCLNVFKYLSFIRHARRLSPSSGTERIDDNRTDIAVLVNTWPTASMTSRPQLTYCHLFWTKRSYLSVFRRGKRRLTACNAHSCAVLRVTIAFCPILICLQR